MRCYHIAGNHLNRGMVGGLPNIHHKVHTGLRIYHYHTDHLGTPQELTNDRGDVVWLNYSLALGGSFDRLNHVDNLDRLDISADLLQPIRFQGQFFDGETNLYQTHKI